MARTKLAHALKAAPLKAKKPKQPKSEPRMVEHKTLGVCTLRCIRALDSNDLVAVVEFSDGTERVIRLDERFSRCPRDRMGLECNRDISTAMETGNDYARSRPDFGQRSRLVRSRSLRPNSSQVHRLETSRTRWDDSDWKS
jgi:hypothetical protein